jgi:hypothetical protein
MMGRAGGERYLWFVADDGAVAMVPASFFSTPESREADDE